MLEAKRYESVTWKLRIALYAVLMYAALCSRRRSGRNESIASGGWGAWKRKAKRTEPTKGRWVRC